MRHLQGFIVLGTRINQVMLLFVVYLRVQCYFVCLLLLFFLSPDCHMTSFCGKQDKVSGTYLFIYLVF